VQVWDLESGECLKTLPARPRPPPLPPGPRRPRRPRRLRLGPASRARAYRQAADPRGVCRLPPRRRRRDVTGRERRRSVNCLQLCGAGEAGEAGDAGEAGEAGPLAGTVFYGTDDGLVVRPLRPPASGPLCA